MTTIGISMFRGDAGKHLVRRVSHLLAKRGVDRWIFMVRPEMDMTAAMLQTYEGAKVNVIQEWWPAVEDRMIRLSVAADVALSAATYAGADRILWHESDLISPPDVVALLARTEGTIVGGWPVLPGNETPAELMLHTGAVRLDTEKFYDTWGYRAGGDRFTNEPPFFPVDGLPRDRPFQLESVGSVALIDASAIRRGARFSPGAFVNLCGTARAGGGTVWCDPRVKIVQPLELWVFHND